MVVTYSGDVAEVDGMRFMRDKRTGYYLASRPTKGETRERLHTYVYRTRVGEIPSGFQVHHIDCDKDNNEPSNLKALSESEHHRLHADAMSDEERAERKRRLIEKAVPKAAEWHRSEEGREWHREHGREVAASLAPRRFTCDNCGAEFLSKALRSKGHRFCSNRCKSAYRRKSGIDDVERECPVCGQVYATNRYNPKKYCCQNCRRAAHRDGDRVQHDR